MTCEIMPQIPGTVFNITNFIIPEMAREYSFFQIEKEDITSPGDVLLFSLESAQINHASVFLVEGEIIHSAI